METATKEAKVTLIIDVSKALKKIEELQRVLDAISLKKIKEDTTATGMDKLAKGTKKVTNEVKTLDKELRKAKKKLDELYFANRMNPTNATAEAFKAQAKEVENLTYELNQYKKFQASLDSDKVQARKNKENAEAIKQAAKLTADIKKSQLETEKALRKEEQERLKQEQAAEKKKTQELKEQEKIRKRTSKESGTNIFKGYSAELARLEKRAAEVYHELKNPLQKTKFAELRNELEQITKEYSKLNRESVKFRQQIGISGSRGFYDLNHSLDYFRAKVRSRLVYSFATELDNILMTAPTAFMNTLSTYQQNKVNFAQVLPDNLANNQAVMNGAMKEFIQIASDYGTAVNDVTEAGRLWGRQYKDISIVQELVRNSTKLSITDNMSLTEVNKGLEATMQQYNIHLKDANEAQQVSGKIVDTWAKLADNAVVTAQDLASANERSAGAAYQAGVGFDYLQAMIATMSTATGKAGGEVGRSIRSMLVSMRSAKAEKEFAKLGIATKELVNGELRVRSFEKVITDLMLKLKTTPKDVSNVILAMSGGKFQYTNVMALLKNYEQMMKNLEVARNSQGWADEQVGRQYETISRQVQALNADLQQLVRILDEAGVSNGIGDLIQGLREVVQILQRIEPETINLITKSLEVLLILKGLKTGFIGLSNSMRAFGTNTNSLKGILSAFNQNIITGKTAMQMFSATILSNIISIVSFIPLLVTLGGLMKGIYEERNKVSYAKDDIVSSDGKISALKDFIDTYKEYIDVQKSETATEEEEYNARKKLVAEQNKLREIIGEEAFERIKNSKEVVSAIEAEIQAVQLSQQANVRLLVASNEANLKRTQIALEESQKRIQIEKDELIETKNALLQRLEMMKKAGFDSDWARNAFGITGLEQAADDLDTSIEQQTAKVSEYRAKIDEIKKEISRLKGDYNQSDIVGGTGGTTDPNKGGTGKNYDEQAKRNQLERERNLLWYQGKIEAQAYENALKSITNLEQTYGATTYSINQKTSLFASRKKDLEDYQIKLESFRDEILADLDKEMQANQDIAEKVGYKSEMTLEQKLQNFEVNKELYQQLKTYSSMVTMVSSLNSKIEENKGKVIEVTNSLSQQEKALMNQEMANINHNYSMIDVMINRPENYNYETQKIKLQIAQQLELIEIRNARIKAMEDDLLNNSRNYDRITLESKRQALANEMLLREQQYQQLAELENRKNYNIRNGLAEITNEFVIQGNSLREIWESLWQDLAREAIQRLFKVKATASLLGSLFGLFGGGASTGTSEWDKMGGFTSAYGIKYHTGANVSAYPKMHNGGVVASGRAGVVPKLQNNEVVRTLQVGEEVNSLQDRRSNEMLTAIVLKALDGQNARPNNFNIMAMDSKSFAEYLNDNADILTAILAKQGAMGRR